MLLIPLVWTVGNAAISGAFNAATQYLSTGQVQWRGVGGVLDAAGDGAILGPALGAVSGLVGGSAAVESAGAPVAKGAAQSSKQAADLSRHLGYAEKYGAGGVQQLENGRFRYDGEVQPANKAGEMAGRRYVHEFDPASGGSRGWHETVDHAGTVRQVRPELNNDTKTHYRFDNNGKYTGSW